MTKMNTFAAAALALALPCLAHSQTSPATQPPAAPVNPIGATADPSGGAPSAMASGMNTASSPVSADQLPQGQAAALSMGDNQVVTNGPIPDTPANRAKYGKPMSNAGRRTAPAGN